MSAYHLDLRGRWVASGITQRDQVELWRAAARGHEAMGRTTEALQCWNTARLILGKPPRKTA